ncbi:MAG: SAM-dependent methyltransferase [Chloroflexi bacterium CG_4_9_14_3_um_filter_45_9]|nr:MAG: SAM-dependent methyltransferase [Dehalococcoidia bacterium CG2_30_46_9]PIU23351.1 MAG: SAM-dependent methyltransferase [Chloroflexi bacterium CG08_land_8_20_14_0_20_45_12]PIX27706.1 MAG: SAM-dependent methyltransferase [Chloroflexi bacterium CG_4_8_14_3_um_filter_45_15]PJB49951.1 MAG: SAM-dependent methyltransferase [Chloroflexi bacterium CG_4_9_14_3_um_filter_45_9]
MAFNRRKMGTKTSAFGSPGRINHDSTAFYASRLYEGLPKEESINYVENPIPSEFLNGIFCKSSEKMAELPDNSVHLMVTSPPYNVGKEYDENITLHEYREFLKRVWSEVRRVLVPGGRACINIANLGRKPYIPLHAFIVEDMLDLGFLMRGEIIWNKASSGSPSTASAEPATKVGHPAPFPVELPYRLIQLYTFEGEIVLDPFIGSGQAAIAAIKTRRHYVGYEIKEEYVKLAERRIKEFSLAFNAPKLFVLTLNLIQGIQDEGKKS